jgi:DNA-binding response OmpR family regulator/cytochrome c551/c552
MPVKILLADKSITIQKVVEMLFSGREYEVVCVSDGEAALQEAERTSPDVVLADVDLPRLDGYGFAGQLKKTPALAQTPVILMMSRDDVYDNAKGKQAGIVDKIVKPFESQELIGKVKKAIAAAPPRAASPEPVAPSRMQVQPPPSTPRQAAPAKPMQAAPSDIFDIISEAPTQAELKHTKLAPAEDSVYEVEPVVEEVEAPLAREEAKALPIGAKAVEEMRANLGLTQTKEEPRPEPESFKSASMATDAERMFAPPKEEPKSAVVDFSSLDMDKESEQLFAPPKEKARPAVVDFESLDMAKDAEHLFAPGKEKPQSEIITFDSLDMARDAEHLFAPPPEKPIAPAAPSSVSPPVQTPTLSEEELRRMAQDTIDKMAADVFRNMPLPTPPKISDEAVRSMAEQTVAKMAEDAFKNIPMPAPPRISDETVRSMAEETVAKMAADVFRNMPPPSPPKISDETIRRSLQEAVQSIARETAREIIEQVAWEVIPQLAETMIQEEIERLKAVR